MALNSNDQATRNIATLTRVIVKISRADPALGEKWRAKMLTYYTTALRARVAEREGSDAKLEKMWPGILEDLAAKIADDSYVVD